MIVRDIVYTHILLLPEKHVGQVAEKSGKESTASYSEVVWGSKESL